MGPARRGPSAWHLGVAGAGLGPGVPCEPAAATVAACQPLQRADEGACWRSDDDADDGVSEDLDAALRSLQAFTKVCRECWLLQSPAGAARRHVAVLSEFAAPNTWDCTPSLTGTSNGVCRRRVHRQRSQSLWGQPQGRSPSGQR